VPSLAGRTLADATATLQNLGLVIAQADDVFSSKVPVGSVVTQDPAADTKLDRGGTVTVAVSKGPDLVAVPPLAALTVQQASDALSAAGLKLGKVKGDQAGVVVLSEANGQVLVAGAQLERGTAVDVTFAVPATSTVPATSKP
jgi:serine/threonine-protein kinase